MIEPTIYRHSGAFMYTMLLNIRCVNTFEGKKMEKSKYFFIYSGYSGLYREMWKATLSLSLFET